MDAIDHKILMELQRNAKQNTKEIAAKVGLSVTPTYERIKKMEQKGVIQKYVAQVDKNQVNKKLTAFCQITLSMHQKALIDRFKNDILLHPEVMECHHVSGKFDFLLKILVQDIESFHCFVNEKLSDIEGIATIQSSFVMNVVKETQVIEL